MKKLKSLFLIILLSHFPFLLLGQLIHGKIISKANSKPIPFSNILIEGLQVGTVSNEDGEFEIKWPSNRDHLTLIVSVIGYKTMERKISKASDFSNVTIQLEISSVELKEVLVSYLTEQKIVANFHKNYLSNYYQGSALYKAFYHSSLSENSEYKHLLHATVNIREFKKKKSKTFEVEITQRRKSNDYRIEKWGEKNNYLFDAISSNPILNKSNFLNPKNQKLYKLKRLENTSYNNELVYVIQFTPKERTSKALFSAKAYFNANDFALIKAEYQFQNKNELLKNQSLKDKTYHIPSISGSVQYQKIGSHYTPKYVSYQNAWTIINNITNDTLVKDILKDEVLFVETNYDYEIPLPNQLTKWGDIYKKPFPYDANYWNKQVKIPSSPLFESVIKDLEKHQAIELQYFNNSSKNVLHQQFDNSTSGRLDSIISIYHLTKLFNGVALISKNGKIIHHKAYGLKNFEDNIDLDTATLFDIGSITKQFTTAIILKLKEVGKLGLEDKIGMYLPEYRYAEQINIHQLLAHRSGIPTYDYQNKLKNSKWFTTKLETKEMISQYCSNDLEFVPGSEMQYSNSNFLILSAIIEEIEHENYFSVLRRMILQPLAMNNTFCADSILAKKSANGYILEDDQIILEPKWEKTNSKGGGSLYSSSGDLYKWLIASNSNYFLSKLDAELIKSPISYYDYYKSDFGYSWAINKHTFQVKDPTYFYGGTSLGFFSMITTIPSQGINIILLNNTGNFPRLQLTHDLLKEITK